MASVKSLDYRRASSQRLDVEIYSVSELRQRVGDERLQPTFRYKFHLLLGVTKGECVHSIDFRRVQCSPGSVLSIQPAQAHRFSFEQDWDGWMVMFRPEFLLPSRISLGVSDIRQALGFDGVPEHMVLEQRLFQITTQTINQMREDLKIEATPPEVHPLLRYQLYGLILRLKLHCSQRPVRGPATSVTLLRFSGFQRLVEDNFAKWHRVADYGKALGCSVKSLTRAAVEVSGLTAKAFVASRVNLEAKRLLVQTDISIAAVGEQLGFEDTTHFVKFFKRETGATPGEFRRNQIGESGV